MARTPPTKDPSIVAAWADGAQRSNWLRRWWPAVLWAVIISLLSTRYFGSDQTSTVIIPVLHWLVPSASYATLLHWHHLIRKAAHFTEYFVFSVLLLRAIRAGRRDVRWSWALEAIAIVAVYAAFDEFHQIFVPGRTPAVRDVLIDTIGGIAAQLLVGLLLLWKRQRERTNELERGQTA